ncbi:MAG: hypothetical protein AAGB14_00355 [Verrucomicrobiota bacterium]
MSDTYANSPFKSFEEETLQALLDKEGFAVALGTNAGTVKLATGPNDAIGVLHSRNTLETTQVTVRLFGNGGSFKAKMGGVVAKGGRVKVANGGKFVASTSGDRSTGIKLSQGNSADNDLVEILDQLETDPS